MKGLFTKDLLWVKQQKKLLLILALLLVMYILMDMEGLVLVLFPPLLTIILGKTIVFDLDDRSSRFLFTLPFTRKQYVLEKYLLCIGADLILILAGWLIGLLRADSMGRAELNQNVIIAALFGILLVAVLIPMMMKFKEKAQIVLMASALALVIVYLFFFDPKGGGIALPELSMTLLMPLAWIAALVILGLSFWVSCLVMKKQEL